MSTLLLHREAVVQSVEALTLLSQLRDSFLESAPAPIASPAVPLHSFGTVATHFPGLSNSIPTYTVTVESHFGPPSTSSHSTVLLYDLRNGALLALLEGNYLALLTRTLVHTLAAEALSAPQACRVAIVGATDLSRRQLKSFRLIRSLKEVKVYDKDLPRAHAFASQIFLELSLPTHEVNSLEETLEGADLVIFDGSKTDFPPGLVFPDGAHVSFLSDLPHLTDLRLFCDNPKLAALKQIPSAADLGSLLRNEIPSRHSPKEVTAFAAFGLPRVDLVAAWHVFQAAQMDDALPRIEFQP